MEGVVEEMNQEFQRLDLWLMQVIYKRKLGMSVKVARGRRMKRQGAPAQR
jgi:hypothetical protein